MITRRERLWFIMKFMKLIIGLGNIGEKYKNTRHNVGFLVLDRLAQMVNGQWLTDKKFKALIINHQSSIIFLKPTTMMNDSGIAVSKLSTYYKLHNTDIYVIHDDLDLKLGQYKIQFGVEPKVHNGIKSINEALHTTQYWRVRVGIDNRKVPQKSEVPQVPQAKGKDYVLSDFTSGEFEILNKVIDNICEDLKNRLKFL